MHTFKEQLTAEARAHTGVTLCRSEDEERVEQHGRETAEQLDYSFWAWSVATGLRCHTDPSKSIPELQELPDLMGYLVNWTNGAAVLVAHDIMSVVNHSEQTGIQITRMLRTLVQLQKALNEDTVDTEASHKRMQIALQQAREAQAELERAYNQGDDEALSKAAVALRNNAASLVAQHEIPAANRVVQLVLCDSEDMSRSCGADAIEMELPSREEIGVILDRFIEQHEALVENQDQILDAVAGLTEFQIHKALLLSFVSTDVLGSDELDDAQLDPQQLQQYKRRALQAKGITWIDPDPRGFDAIGGLEPLKEWLRARALTFTPEAVEYDVEPARGVIVSGPPGVGKSLVAKCVSWGIRHGKAAPVPLLYANIGQTRGRFHGQSEQNFERILDVADAIAGTDGGAAILWIDEVDKGLSGGVGSADLDSGVAARTLQIFQTWLQEHKSRVFVFMTANTPNVIPPEILRAGRIDGHWWIGYPTDKERWAICKIYRDRYSLASEIDLDELVLKSSFKTGAEIELAWKEAAITAMVNQTDSISTADVVRQLELLPRIYDTFKLSPDLEQWKKSAMRANDADVMKLDFQTPAAAGTATGGACSGTN